MAAHWVESHWGRGRAVREAYARHELGNVLGWAFDELDRAPAEDLEVFIPEVCRRVAEVEPSWKPAMDGLKGIPETSLRGDLKKAFATIRAIAHNVATGETTGILPVKVGLYLPGKDRDRDGRPAWNLDGRLADALTWAALKLFSEVPRSLIRRCNLEGCSRVYVGVKNQQFCRLHVAEAQRLTQRRAEKAFRARQRAQRAPNPQRRTT
jgi:hypothetical protein